jgi:hypothetical protein
MKPLAAVALVVTLAALALADPKATHTGSLRSSRVEVRYRPNSLAAATAESALDAAERDLDRIGKTLDVKPKGPFTLWLYDDTTELAAITGTNRNGGFTNERDVNIPFGNAQTRLHELVHAVQSEMPKAGDEPRNQFLNEGLANAVVEFVDGVHVHAVAAFYLKRDELPALKDMTTGDFYAFCYAHPKFRSYDVAGSWMRFLLDRFGAAKVKQYVMGATAKKAFDADVDALEKSWRDFVGKFPVRAETETLLRQGAGEAVGFEPYVKGLPPELAGKPADWTPLLGKQLKLTELAKWNREDGVLTGTNADPQWTFCDFGEDEYGDCAVRATIKTTGLCALGVRIGDANRALLVNGTFIYRGDTYVASSQTAQMTPARTDTDFVVVRRGAQLEIWIDGAKALTGPAVVGPARVGVGVALGSAKFTDVRVRKL